MKREDMVHNQWLLTSGSTLINATNFPLATLSNDEKKNTFYKKEILENLSPFTSSKDEDTKNVGRFIASYNSLAGKKKREEKTDDIYM